MVRKKKVMTPAEVQQQGIEAFLDLTPLPDPPSATSNRVRGCRSGLGVRSYIWHLLAANERLPKSKKMTNIMIEKNVRDEYPDRTELHKSLEQGLQSVNWWRHLFNTQKLISTLRTAIISLRYDHHGDPVDSRTGSKVLSESQIHDLCRKYDLEDPRFT
jgi:hypothetical protein